MTPRKILIAGAGGRDFHNFNVLYRGDPSVRVVCFTATQIPNIDDRRYPPELAGPLYPEGIPIHDEAELVDLIRRHGADEVLFSYSDVSHQHVMAVASRAIAAGAAFRLAGTAETMIRARRPGRFRVRRAHGQREVADLAPRLPLLSAAGKRVVVVRHPMPYGDLARQRVQRFAELADLNATRARSRSARSTSRTSRRATSSTRAATTRRSCAGGDGGGRRPLGRGEQRLLVLPADGGDRRGRPAPRRARADVLPGPDQP